MFLSILLWNAPGVGKVSQVPPLLVQVSKVVRYVFLYSCSITRDVCVLGVICVWAIRISFSRLRLFKGISWGRRLGASRTSCSGHEPAGSHALGVSLVPLPVYKSLGSDGPSRVGCFFYLESYGSRAGELGAGSKCPLTLPLSHGSAICWLWSRSRPLNGFSSMWRELPLGLF